MAEEILSTEWVDPATGQKMNTIRLAGATDKSGNLAGNVVVANGGNFTGSSYTPRLTMNGTAQGGAVPTGATAFKVQNNGTTGQNVAVVFGATQLEADNNLTIVAGAATTGGEFAPIVDGGTPPPENIPPAGIGGFYAICNTVALDTQEVSLGFGV